MNYEELIKNWHRKAGRQKDIFSKYVFEYLAFIAILKTRFSNGNHRDRPILQYFKNQKAIKDIYMKKVQADSGLKKDWQLIISELDRVRLGAHSRDLYEPQEIDWWNNSHRELNQKTEEETSRDTGRLYGLQDWENMIEFWYAIRNNLFHGSKDPNKERDQLLINYGHRTLRPLVRILIYELSE